MSLSLGDSAKFTIATHERTRSTRQSEETGGNRHESAVKNDEEEVEVRLDSGDLVMFNGGVNEHGISHILPGTAPEFWEDGNVPTFSFRRLNVQFRSSPH
jgi:alkylated DNA repair dioxygenase AlkB